MSEPKYDLMIRAAKAMMVRNMKLNMRHFRSDSVGPVAQENLEHPCGSMGCILGNSPFCGIPELEILESDLEPPGPEVNWNHYCRRVYNVSAESPLWRHLFGPSNPDSYPGFILRVENLQKTKEELGVSSGNVP